MRLRYLKQEMLLPKEDYIINKRVNIQGVDVLVLSFTIEKSIGKNVIEALIKSGI